MGGDFSTPPGPPPGLLCVSLCVGLGLGGPLLYVRPVVEAVLWAVLFSTPTGQIASSRAVSILQLPQGTPVRWAQRRSAGCPVHPKPLNKSGGSAFATPRWAERTQLWTHIRMNKSLESFIDCHLKSLLFLPHVQSLLSGRGDAPAVLSPPQDH